jgi:hypothetical protein
MVKVSTSLGLCAVIIVLFSDREMVPSYVRCEGCEGQDFLTKFRTPKLTIAYFQQSSLNTEHSSVNSCSTVMNNFLAKKAFCGD